MSSPLGTADVFRTTFSRVVAVLVVAVCAVALVMLAIAGADALLRSGGFFAVVGVGAWVLFWQPFVRIDDTEITLANVLRTIVIPWAAVVALESRWSFTVETAQGRYSAWASPGRSGMAARVSPPRRRAAVGASETDADGATAGERQLAEGNDADAVALAAAARLSALRDAGRLGGPSDVTKTWNVPAFVALAVSLAWVVAGTVA